jgi:hypothetical protein
METTILTPRTPNFISVRLSKDVHQVPVAEFTDEQLTEIGRKWTAELLLDAKKKRQNRI